MNTIKILGDRLLIRRKPVVWDSLIEPPPGLEVRNAHFEAVVVQVGTALTEDIKPGDLIVVQGLHTQVGSQLVLMDGEALEIISTLDVAVVRNRAEFRIKEFSPGRWHVLNPAGNPIYDDAPHGKDRPLVFDDEDVAADYAYKCNEGPQE